MDQGAPPNVRFLRSARAALKFRVRQARAAAPGPWRRPRESRNVLIALLDTDHVSHQTALAWFVARAKAGWASCPITQNGCVRIMSNPSYLNPLPVQALVKRLAEACNQPVHEFRADESSLLDANAFDATRIHGPRQITDVYLLALGLPESRRTDSCPRPHCMVRTLFTIIYIMRMSSIGARLKCPLQAK